jgi:hypothetical protein
MLFPIPLPAAHLHYHYDNTFFLKCHQMACRFFGLVSAVSERKRDGSIIKPFNGCLSYELDT